MTHIDLSQKSILITGSLGAIAEHIVRKLSEAGAFLVLTDAVSEADALPMVERWGIASGYTYRQMDVTDPSAVETVIDEVMNCFSNLDTVLGHAGGCGLHPFVTTTQTDFDRIFKFNFLAQTYLARAVIPRWLRRKAAGHLIFTSSYVALIPHTRIAAYATAKAALEHLTRCLALEHARDGIRVNAIAPGNVAAGSSLKVFEEDKAYREFVLRVAPTGKRNSPEAIAHAFTFLCSEMAKEMTGQIVRVDFGVTIPKIG
jgi:NAD(P)-dependent dehydrogenase (short-subunit alcohol dehydrogenase family)